MAGRTHSFGRGRGRTGAAALVMGLAAGLVVPVASTVADLASPAPPEAAAPPKATTSRPELPVVFEPNVGQAGDGGGFVSRGDGLALALRPTEAHFVVGEGDTPASASLRLVGANSGATMEPAGRQKATTSYFIGNDPAKWHTGVATYARVVSKGVYPGIDLAWHGGSESKALEYDFIVAPGADAAPIVVTVNGANALTIDAGGDLVANLAGGQTLRQHKPVAYQTDAKGRRTSVEAAFRLDGDQVRFVLGAYDRGRELVIDPVLAWSTYLGGETSDAGAAVALDAAGNLYAAGDTRSLQFPVTTGAVTHTPATFSDVFVTKWDSSGNLLYSAMIGGAHTDTPVTDPSGGDNLSVSPDGFVHVVGTTSAVDFPVVNPAGTCQGGAVDPVNGADIFAFKLDQTASSIVYSRCFGVDSQQDLARGSALDSAGNLYISGWTKSKLFPVFKNEHLGLKGVCLGHSGDPNLVEGDDIVLMKLGPDGTTRYSTCWGGTNGDQGRGVDVDNAGNVYVVGRTNSTDFPLKNASLMTGPINFDAGFLVKFALGARPKLSTFVGREGPVQDVEVHNGKVYIAGGIVDTDFATQWPDAFANAYSPTSAGGIGDGYVLRLRFDPSAPHTPIVDRGTYIGGNGRDYPLNLEVGAGAVWLTFDGESTNFPEVNRLQACGTFNNWVVRFDKPLTTLNFSSCIGGATTLATDNSSEQIDGLALDSAGNAYLTGRTRSTNFPTTPGAYDTTCGTDGLCGNTTTNSRKQDAFLVKLAP